MATNTAPTDPSQIIDLELEPEPTETTNTTPAPVSQPYVSPQASVKTLSWAQAVKPTVKSTPAISTDKKIICWDCETTGVNPWDYRLVVASFWDLSLPVSQMITFADWDEEALCREIADYLNAEAPDLMTGFNTAFDIRALVSRCMFYQQPCPAIFSASHEDTRDLMKKGIWGYVYSDQASGTLEEWAKYLYDESKPFTIEEIFAAMDEGDLNPSMVRNRWDVYIEGQIYILSKYVQNGDIAPEFILKPTLAQRDESKAAGVVSVKCPTCYTINEFPLDRTSIECYVCANTIARPSSLGMLQEVTRPIVTPAEAAAQAAALKKSTATKKTTTAKA